MEMLSVNGDRHGPTSVIGVRIRHHRWMLGMERADLARSVALDLDEMIAVEYGNAPVSDEKLQDIAAVLAVPVRTLVSDGDPEPVPPAGRMPVGTMIRKALARCVSDLALPA